MPKAPHASKQVAAKARKMLDNPNTPLRVRGVAAAALKRAKP
jgi:hypothetical protein